MLSAIVRVRVSVINVQAYITEHSCE